MQTRLPSTLNDIKPHVPNSSAAVIGLKALLRLASRASMIAVAGLVVAASAVFADATPARSQILIGGGALPETFQDLTGWTSTSPTKFDLANTGFDSTGGAARMKTNSIISATITGLTTGVTYALSYYTKVLQGSLTMALTNTLVLGPLQQVAAGGNWVRNDITFSIAGGNSSVISFQAAGCPGNDDDDKGASQCSLVDLINMRPVPGPLAGSGIASFGMVAGVWFMRRRRRQQRAA